MIDIIWPSIAQSSKEKSLADCQSTDKTRRIRKKPLPVGTQAMILREQRANKQEERYDGPYTIVQLNPRSKAYRVTELLGNLVKRVVPLSKIKPLEFRVPQEELKKHWEISKVLRHRGPPGKREYSVVWKGWKGATWVAEADFSSKECIKAYWKTEKTHKAPMTPTTDAPPSTPPILLRNPPTDITPLHIACIYLHIPETNPRTRPTTNRKAFIKNSEFFRTNSSPTPATTLKNSAVNSL
jgi:hypothetical protein